MEQKLSLWEEARKLGTLSAEHAASIERAIRVWETHGVDSLEAVAADTASAKLWTEIQETLGRINAHRKD